MGRCKKKITNRKKMNKLRLCCYNSALKQFFKKRTSTLILIVIFGDKNVHNFIENCIWYLTNRLDLSFVTVWSSLTSVIIYHVDKWPLRHSLMLLAFTTRRNVRSAHLVLSHIRLLFNLILPLRINIRTRKCILHRWVPHQVVA